MLVPIQGKPPSMTTTPAENRQIFPWNIAGAVNSGEMGLLSLVFKSST